MHSHPWVSLGASIVHQCVRHKGAINIREHGSMMLYTCSWAMFWKLARCKFVAALQAGHFDTWSVDILPDDCISV